MDNKQLDNIIKNHHITIQQLNDKVDFLVESVGLDKGAFNRQFAEIIQKIYTLTGEVVIEEYNLEENL